MKASVDPEICIGCTLCTQTCPGVFKMKDGKSIAYKNPVPDAFKEACKNAAQECPASAIMIEE
ncbi:MAG: ferredoxin [Candidatus Omnitrophica bacterium CG07_land_8_20_14_0_80_42_15]|uniref:Ferredoxin n=1 Tax=Candidatus Aquitaenariimonas noxiae TaxID=1974741 RepID=A0A2J0KVJ0_9BACT|nr:MAG: ferredoxin [Candidatus Omnitrophica bacterium CG07_land_8_20_14_0_80_42_15]